MEHQVHPPGKDQDVYIVLQNFLNVRRLNSRLMSGSGDIPIPLRGPRRPHFVVLELVRRVLYSLTAAFAKLQLFSDTLDRSL